MIPQSSVNLQLVAGPLTWERALALVIVASALVVNGLVALRLSRRSYRAKFNASRQKGLPVLGLLIGTDVILAGLFIAVATRLLAI